MEHLYVCIRVIGKLNVNANTSRCHGGVVSPAVYVLKAGYTLQMSPVYHRVETYNYAHIHTKFRDASKPKSHVWPVGGKYF